MTDAVRRFTDAEHQSFVDGKRQRRMASVDAMPAALRGCVHEYGLNVVKTLHDLGVKEPRHIRHIVETILDEFSPTRGTFATQGLRGALIKPQGRGND
jgi:hypothetical protein